MSDENTQGVTKSTVLVVDDDLGVRTMLDRSLRSFGCSVRTAGSLAEGRAAIEAAPVDLLLVDFELPDGNGPDLARVALASGRASRAYCITGVATCANVVAAMRAGCADVFEKPVVPSQLRSVLIPSVSRESDLGPWRRRYASSVIGTSAALTESLEIVRSVADTHCTVLVTGESGTGKELFARALHEGSRRREKAFVAINCAAIPENLIEDELFGHARGAFTGAVGPREGHIAAADGGTLFLDEIGDLPLAAQAKLLRVLQDHKLTPVGADRPISIDVRVVAATNRDLEAMVEAGQFRADLYFRLAVIHVELPSLRERKEDILPIARHLLASAARRAERDCPTLDASAEELLTNHAWRGNVRELANVVERAMLLKAGGLLTATDLRLGPRRVSTPMAVAAAARVTQIPLPPPISAKPDDGSPLDLRTAVEAVEREMIQKALERTAGNRTEAAMLLGLNRTTLVEKLRKLGS